MPVIAQSPASSPNRSKTSDGSSNKPATSSQLDNPTNASDIPPAPELHVNGKPAPAHDTNPAAVRPSRSLTPGHQPEDGWGSNFWVTLVDPQVCLVFSAVIFVSRF